MRHEDMRGALQVLSLRLSLVAFAGATGLVRTTNVDKDDAIRALNGIDTIAGQQVRVRTIGTSGTIQSATEKYLRSRRRIRREPGLNPYK